MFAVRLYWSGLVLAVGIVLAATVIAAGRNNRVGGIKQDNPKSQPQQWKHLSAGDATPIDQAVNPTDSEELSRRKAKNFRYRDHYGNPLAKHEDSLLNQRP